MWTENRPDHVEDHLNALSQAIDILDLIAAGLLDDPIIANALSGVHGNLETALQGLQETLNAPTPLSANRLETRPAA